MAKATAEACPRLLLQLLLLLLCFASPELVVHGQPDSLGFISIDCGIADGTSYSDESVRGLRYVSDVGFVDASAGVNGRIAPSYSDRDLAMRYLNVRYFPGARVRSCYTLAGLSLEGRYLVRGTFYYGNYDSLNRLPTFDLHLGVNRWATVNFNAADDTVILEAVVVSPADFLQVCLVDIGQGTPFISGLDLRPLKAGMYPEATVSQSLFLLSHHRLGARFRSNRYHFSPAYRVFSDGGGGIYSRDSWCGSMEACFHASDPPLGLAGACVADGRVLLVAPRSGTMEARAVALDGGDTVDLAEGGGHWC
ncbi:hypothetical protein QYE76_001633 [Lolium multiflorum]|uniref:Malectin-like domain-containing protein n=1 Tax=Lolium multiflorum TaxID=4521 RepID=A0AAD8VZJ2_LOLMU|nr:hypothetical protein QYE76_001633 [Lolium multiflorum]